MEELRKLLLENLSTYPAMQIQDAVKLVYQNEFGGGHLVSDRTACLKRLQNELAACTGAPPLAASLGNGLCRLNLAAVCGRITPEALCDMFIASSAAVRGDRSRFRQKLELIKTLNFPPEETETFLRAYVEAGYPAVSHSPQYREAYAPAYRVLMSEYAAYFEVFAAVSRLAADGGNHIIAIDGCCASGKSSLGDLLQGVFGCSLFHMDDFFLPPHRRTEERLGEPGGNVDRERFAQEVLAPLRAGLPVALRRFDCRTASLLPPVTVPFRNITVVEGAYSLHPELRDFYDLKVFLRVPREEQLRRILSRDGEDMLPRFRDVWIPLEERYFEAFSIRESCDLVYDSAELVPIKIK